MKNQGADLLFGAFLLIVIIICIMVSISVYSECKADDKSTMYCMQLVSS